MWRRDRKCKESLRYHEPEATSSQALSYAATGRRCYFIDIVSRLCNGGMVQNGCTTQIEKETT
jgi:hypothetical protein